MRQVNQNPRAWKEVCGLTGGSRLAKFLRLAQELPAGATSELFARFLRSPSVTALGQRTESGDVLSLGELNPASHPFFAILLQKLLPGRVVVAITPSLRVQESFHQDVATWLAQESQDANSSGIQAAPPVPLFFPAWEVMPHEARLPHVDVISERLQTLVALGGPGEAISEAQSRARAPLVVASVSALLQRTFPHGYLENNTRAFRQGDRIDPLDLVEWLEDRGYEPEAQVTGKGEIALRGGILDIFPLTSPWPVRLEFFGDEIESLRLFDPITQMSREATDQVVLPPGGELGILKRFKGSGEVSQAAAALSTDPALPVPPNLGSLLDYLPAGSVILECEPDQLDERAEEYQAQVPKDDPFLMPWSEFRKLAVDRGMLVVKVSDLARSPGLLGPPSEAALGEGSVAGEPRFESLDAFRPLAERAPEPQVAELQRREFFGQIHRWLRQGYEVRVFCSTAGERQRFSEIWADYGLSSGQPATPLPEGGESLAEVGPGLVVGSLARGFLCDEAKTVVITDAEIYGRYKIQRPRRLKSPHAQATRSALDIDFSELEEGDYVVHLEHGIGRYLGLQVIPAGAGTKATEGLAAAAHSGQECLVLEYAPHDSAQPPPRLYVPVTEAHLVSKYVGTGKARPPLNTLGGTRWAKAKEKAAEAVRDIASEMLSIQAARESQAGHAFGADVPWQREFESAFIFEETPDQMRAIQETKVDMERPKPMDRLICGDVGFGKTEVAIRAAFKAVMDGRQVAVLVPTTVLAQQHFNTFRDRMADYPVRIELLSRFRTRRAQQKVIKDLAAGSVDIVIGTHRLVQSDVGFKDLGLVVIDEEQRFGVLHKEKFKMLRRMVDVLTLSATPIPRTLYLALAGARDMSTIQTPPHDRLPVETTVTEYDERLIRDAIQRELGRGGQVFFLHNRVATIATMAQKLQDLVPHARIAVGHGQMDSDDLEEVMSEFVNGKADVLLSTTIIESGLDIPNANTIIIDRADRFGLSDLYQLRGRVGRYKHQAYAYLLLPRHARLLTDVRKRMSAIKQFSTLGSGFKIAMRDLEIRGAGNLLGAEQSGHITAVGFDLYCQLLKQSVSALKGEKVQPRLEVQIRLDFLALSPSPEASPERERTGTSGNLATSQRADARAGGSAKESAVAYIPFRYISDTRQRFEIYRRLAQTSDLAGLAALEKEVRDRFGPIPPALELLLRMGELKILAAQRRIQAIEVKEDKLMLTREGDFIMAGTKFPRLTKKDAGARLKEIRRFLSVL
jgi:transcription-repair coupling factor (superfamily II helicase)